MPITKNKDTYLALAMTSVTALPFIAGTTLLNLKEEVKGKGKRQNAEKNCFNKQHILIWYLLYADTWS